MNRILFTAMLVFLFFTGPRASSQLITYHFTADDEYVTSNVPLNEINARAFRNFIKTYGFVSPAVWRKSEKGYTVRWFDADSVEYMVHYTLRGMLYNAHVYYTSQNAPREIRAEIKHLYPAYDLLFVNELEDGDHPLFEVGLVDNGLTLIADVEDNEVRAEQFFAN